MRNALEAVATVGLLLACAAAFVVFMGLIALFGLYALTWVYIHFGDQIINAWHSIVQAWEGFYGSFR